MGLSHCLARPGQSDPIFVTSQQVSAVRAPICPMAPVYQPTGGRRALNGNVLTPLRTQKLSQRAAPVEAARTEPTPIAAPPAPKTASRCECGACAAARPGAGSKGREVWTNMPFVAQEAPGAGGPWRSGSASYNAGERMPLGLGRTLSSFIPTRVGACCSALSFGPVNTHASPSFQSNM